MLHARQFVLSAPSRSAFVVPKATVSAAGPSASAELRSRLTHWSEEPNRGAPLRGIYRRLLDAAADLAQAPDRVGYRDVVALVGQVLRHESVSTGHSASLTVPSAAPWPTAAQWRAAGFSVSEAGGRIRIEAGAWSPDWIQGPRDAIDLAISAPFGVPERDGQPAVESLRRTITVVTADPFFEAVTGNCTYQGEGQREATRAILTAAPGSTILVSLPTGTGKTATALVPALVGGPTGLTVIIVPTIALAVDQERAVGEYRPLLGTFEPPFAYHSGLEPALQQRIRERVRSGEQRILITSPEAALGALAPALFDAAAAGALRYLVIDEAHMVAEWGVEFRPEFQLLSGLRRALLWAGRAQGVSRLFRTVLLSATLPEESISILDTLFGADGMEVVSATTLRPEPLYLLAPCNSTEQRTGRLIEAVAHLPRPMVVYVTKPQHADALAVRLDAEGFRRIRVVTGRTPAAARRSALDAWRGSQGRTRSDVVIASAAFGLGVDLSDVRTVVHACIPETVDRFYQEVGRGGRDGHASLSLLMPAPADIEEARSLSVPTQVGLIKAVDRWEALMDRSEPLPDGRLRIDLRARRTGIVWNSKANIEWNVRTLALFARAEMIDIDIDPPPRRRADEEIEEWDARAGDALKTYRVQAVVALRRSDLRQSAAWERDFHRVRDRTTAHFARSFSQMLRITQGACPTDVFARTYTVGPLTLQSGNRLRIVPRGRCGGCPVHPVQPADGEEILPPPVSSASHVSQALAGLAPPEHPIVASYPRATPPQEWTRLMRDLLRKLVQHGIQEIVAPDALIADRLIRELYRWSPEGFVFVSHTLHPVTGPVRPTVMICSSSPADQVIPRPYLERHVSKHPFLLVVPDDARDPERPNQPLRLTRTPHWPVVTLLSAL